MNDDLKDAETWFKTASSIIEENPRVACAQFSHAMIKSLDALFKEKLVEPRGSTIRP